LIIIIKLIYLKSESYKIFLNLSELILET
jgi:hypothetical protein